MKRYNYTIEQGITAELGNDTDYVEVDNATNLDTANKCFNTFKRIGDTQQHHHFFQETQLLRIDEDGDYELLRTETWEFTGMKGKRVA